MKKNFQIHVLEGALYIGSGAFLSAQTMYPALLTRMGAGNIAIGGLPVVTYVFFFLPQVIAANFVGRHGLRKPWVLNVGILQRLHVGALALTVALSGYLPPAILLPLFFAIFISNQVMAGVASPAWFDFVMKTTSLHRRGLLLGLRTSFGSLVGFANGMVLTILLTTLDYPWSYGSAIGLGFLFQLSSWVVQRNVVESHASPLRAPVPFRELGSHIRAILASDKEFVRFLVASAFLILGFAGVGFFTVSALNTYGLSESAVGIYTMLTIGAQIASGAVSGWISDKWGSKYSALLSGTSLTLALLCAAAATTPEWYYPVFIFMGITIGAELMARYNFTAECSPESERVFYVGLMNAWMAPWYLGSLLGGWISDLFGYRVLFAGCLLFALTGLVILSRIRNPRRRHLAVSSK